MSYNLEYFKIIQKVSSVETFYALQDGSGLVFFTSFHKERKKERKQASKKASKQARKQASKQERKKERKKEREREKERKKERKKESLVSVSFLFEPCPYSIWG